MSLYDVWADKMARSFTVGRHHGREEILALLKAKYPTEADLRAMIDMVEGKVRAQIAKAEDEDMVVVSIATLEDGRVVTPATVPSFKCPRCGATSYNPDDIANGYCGACRDWTGRP